MTLVSSIILDAFRESNVLALNAPISDAMQTEALRIYNAMMSSVYGTDVGEILRDWPLGQFGYDPDLPTYGYIPPSTVPWLRQPPFNVRLIALNIDPISVDLTLRPQDGARYAIVDPYQRLETAPVTLNGNGRPIEGQPTLTLDTNGLSTTWVYRADIGNWVKLTSLLLTDENPFPVDFDELFWCRLALRLNPRYGRSIAPETQEALSVMSRDFKARYITSQPLMIDESISWPFMSRQGYDTQRSFSSTPGFNRGSPYG